MKLFVNEFIKDYKKISTYLYLLVSFIIALLINFARTRGGIEDAVASDLLSSSLSLSTGLAYIFILIMFANNLSQEYSRGTIKFLYSKPKSRSRILTSKIFLAVFNFIFFTILITGFDLLLKKYVFYKGKINLHTALLEKLPEGYFNRTLWQNLAVLFLAVFVTVIFYLSLVLIICVLFKTQILSLVVVLVMVLGGEMISNLSLLILPKFEYIKYIFTNIQMIPSYFTDEASRKIYEETFKLNSQSLLLMVLCYTVFFVLVSYIVNARRDVTID